MKTLFIPVKKKLGRPEVNDKLPKKIHLLYSIQYEELATEVKSELEKKGHKVVNFQQVLGCSKIKPEACLLLVGSGEFHALQLAFKTKKPIYIYEDGGIRKIDRERVEKEGKRRKAKRSKFYSEKEIGVLISNKPGQKNLKILKKLRKEYKDKKFYSFIANNLSIKELDNYPLKIWINSACPGIEYDSNKVLNYENINKK